MLLLLCVPMTKECLGDSTPDAWHLIAVPNSHMAPRSSAEQPAAESSDSTAQPASQYNCAGVGDINGVAHILVNITIYAVVVQES